MKTTDVNLSPVRSRGLRDEVFLAAMLSRAARFSALAGVLGRDRAWEMLTEVTAGSPSAPMPRAMSLFTPGAEELSQCGDPFRAFKEYLAAQFDAGRQAGLMDVERVEDGENAFQINVTYCAFAEIRRLTGEREATLPSCRADEVFFPALGREAGFVFKERNGTIARGAACCDMRFERVKG